MKQSDRLGAEASPLGPALARYAQGLEEGGYRKATTDQYLSICRKFDGHVARRQIALADLREDHVEAFLVEATAGRRLRRRGRLARRLWRIPLLQLIEQLRSDGVVPPTDVPTEVPEPGLAEYLVFLREHRGLSQRTVDRQRRHVGRLLAHLRARTKEDLCHVSVEQIDRFLVEVARRMARSSIGSVSASLRGFLGHLYMRGVLPSDLRGHVATPRIYPLETIPRSVPWSEVERTLATIDRCGPMPCRDYAVLALVAYCGLRAGDVAALRLGDLDWRHDVIHAHRPKGGTTDDVPLIPVVGEALIAYLRHRPEGSPHTEVFLTVKAPVSPLTGARRNQLLAGVAGAHVRRSGITPYSWSWVFVNRRIGLYSKFLNSSSWS